MTSTGPYSSEGSRGGRAFLRRRVGQFGLVAAAIFAFTLFMRVVVEALLGRMDVFVDPSVYLHFLAVQVFLAIWVFCGRRGTSYRFIRTVEAAGLLLGSAALISVGVFVPDRFDPAPWITLALAQWMFARAIYVPSSARRTLTLAGAIGLALIVAVSFFYGGVMPWEIALAAISWAVTTGICVAGSRVIYGLRKQVDAAAQLGQYTLEEKLGEGAMGVVYRARHAMLARPTAVKLLMPDRMGETALARFEREVQMTAQLTHPHTVTIFDYGRTPEGTFYYAMELLEGAALDRIIEVGGPQPAERVAYVMDQVAAALSEAHDHGLIHRDIKPANIILTEQGGEPDVAKVVDFGLVKDVREEDDPNLSSTGAIAGTPFYMAPETILAYQEIDGRTDLYALGAVCYFMLTGEPVFKGRNAGEVCTQHVHAEPVPPSKRCDHHVPSDLESLVLACLAKDPADRPATAGHIRARLWAGGTVRKWNTDRARRWWRRYGDEVKEKATSTEEAGKTIAVDVMTFGGE
ncbi:MAG: protein kinase [Planctomycetota bacterium]